MTERDLYEVGTAAWMAIAAGVFIYLLVRPAPYGRHAGADSGFGPLVPARWAWMGMELPAVAGTAIVVFASGGAGAGSWALFGLWQIHYLHRALVYPFRLPKGARPMPLAVAAAGFAFNAVNALLIGRALAVLAPRGADWLADPRFVAGAALFLFGLAVNLHADAVLLGLKRRGAGYVIPEGGLFRFVSCPNYLGEILEWAGFALAAYSLAGLAFAVWTAANLVPRALMHHRWYRERFPDYPRERRALVPGVL